MSLFCDQEKQLPWTQSSHTQRRNIGAVLGLQARHCQQQKEQSAEDTLAPRDRALFSLGSSVPHVSRAPRGGKGLPSRAPTPLTTPTALWVSPSSCCPLIARRHLSPGSWDAHPLPMDSSLCCALWGLHFRVPGAPPSFCSACHPIRARPARGRS